MTFAPRSVGTTVPLLVLAVLAAVALRCRLMAGGAGSFDDPDNYLELARTLASGQGFMLNGRPTAYRPPFYPILLAPLVMVTGDRVIVGIALFHLALGAATVVLTALAARGWGLSRRRMIVAAWIVALDPVLAWQCRFIMTETLTACLSVGAVAAMTLPGWHGTVLGASVLGLAVLSRPSMLPGALLIVMAGVLVRPGPRRERVVRSTLTLLMLILVLAPWTVRNTLIFGEPICTTTHGGYTLALANNEVYYRDVLNGPPGSVWTGHEQWLWWDSVTQDTTGMTEPQADRFHRDRVIALAIRQPRQFLRASLQRLARFWSVAPAVAVYSRLIRWATAAWTFPLLVAFAIGLARPSLWRWPQVVAPLSIAGLCLVHTIFWTDLRMRAPIVPAIALVAASAVLPAGRRRSKSTTIPQIPEGSDSPQAEHAPPLPACE